VIPERSSLPIEPIPVVPTETSVYCAAKPAASTPMPESSSRSAEVALL
jgi:hypothetical protein